MNVDHDSQQPIAVTDEGRPSVFWAVFAVLFCLSGVKKTVGYALSTEGPWPYLNGAVALILAAAAVFWVGEVRTRWKRLRADRIADHQ